MSKKVPRKGFSAHNNFDDFPLSVTKLLFPDEQKIKPLESIEGNHDFIENSEYNTNGNILEGTLAGLQKHR